MIKKILKEIIFWIAIIILIILGASIIFDLIYLIFKYSPPIIIRIFITWIFIFLMSKYTLIGKEVDRKLIKLGKKFKS